MSLAPRHFYRKILRAVRNVPNLLQGYNLYVNREKLRLVEYVFNVAFPEATSFADLGGVWKVNAAYTIHSLRQQGVKRGALVDTDYPRRLREKLQNLPQLKVVQGDFGREETAAEVGEIDVLYMFDVLLHQANPHWNEVLAMYAKSCTCFVIYNQQYVLGEDAVRLTDLPLEKYAELTSDYRYDFYRQVFEHKSEMHPQHNKPWGDIHNITQCGITDKALRMTMANLGYDEVYFSNHGRFLDLPAFENHAFIFRRRMG